MALELEGHIKEHLKTKLQEGYKKYWQAVHPFPFDPIEDIYRYAYTDEEWDMLQYMLDPGRPLGSLEQSFNMRSRFRLHLPQDVEERVTGGESIDIYLHRDMPFVEGFTLSRFPEHARKKVEPWMERWALFERGRVKLEDFTRDILYVSNTVGQLVRLWPVTENFLPQYTQETYRKHAKVRSAIPAEAGEWKWSESQRKNRMVGVHPKYDHMQIKNIERMLAGSTLLETELDNFYPRS